MTKEEIKAMIAQKIEGQGTNLDAASVLPTILNYLVDNMEGESFTFNPVESKQDVTREEINQTVLNGKYDVEDILNEKYKFAEGNNYKFSLTWVYREDETVQTFFGAAIGDFGGGVAFRKNLIGGELKYSFEYHEF